MKHFRALVIHVVIGWFLGSGGSISIVGNGIAYNASSVYDVESANTKLTTKNTNF